jgi:hypothetical protein
MNVTTRWPESYRMIGFSTIPRLYFEERLGLRQKKGPRNDLGPVGNK